MPGSMPAPKDEHGRRLPPGSGASLPSRGLQGLTDDELIAQAPTRSSLSHPHHEMEMQRRLKDSIEKLTKETARARWWAFWGRRRSRC